MRSSVRQITVILLLAVLLAPGLVQARTPVRHWAPVGVVGVSPESGFVTMVWNLLAGFLGGGSGSLLKTGSQLDPAGTTTPGTSTTTTTTSSSSTDTGSQLDPAGQP